MMLPLRERIGLLEGTLVLFSIYLHKGRNLITHAFHIIYMIYLESKVPLRAIVKMIGSSMYRRASMQCSKEITRNISCHVLYSTHFVMLIPISRSPAICIYQNLEKSDSVHTAQQTPCLESVKYLCSSIDSISALCMRRPACYSYGEHRTHWHLKCNKNRSASAHWAFAALLKIYHGTEKNFNEAAMSV